MMPFSLLKHDGRQDGHEPAPSEEPGEHQAEQLFQRGAPGMGQHQLAAQAEGPLRLAGQRGKQRQGPQAVGLVYQRLEQLAVKVQICF